MQWVDSWSNRARVFKRKQDVTVHIKGHKEFYKNYPQIEIVVYDLKEDCTYTLKDWMGGKR
jgi:hypothetical protein